MTTIHFHSSDPRFCASTEQNRRFTLEPNEVTCERCKGADTFELTEQGRAAVAEYKATPEPVVGSMSANRYRCRFSGKKHAPVKR